MPLPVPTHQGGQYNPAMNGQLLSACNPNIVVASYNQTTRQTFGGDTIAMSTLLAASNCSAIDLDAISTANLPGNNMTVRAQGLIISMPITYKNMQKIGDWNTLAYTYEPAGVDGESYSQFDTQFNAADGSLTYTEKHGIKINFSQTGTIGTFNFLTMLSSLVGGMALLSVASTLTECEVLPRWRSKAKMPANTQSPRGSPHELRVA